jgi:PAS domain-containing protein
MDHVLYTEIYDRELRNALLSPETSFGLACWMLACGAAPLPHEEDLLRRLPRWMEPDLIVAAAEGPDDFLYERYGSATTALTGHDMTGRRVSEFQGPLRDFYQSVFSRALAERIPIATVHRLGHFNARPLWERVILPTLRAGAPTVLYMVNRARRIGDDIGQKRPRAKGNALLLLQFLREGPTAVDALIVGANQAARALTGRRLDELLHRPMLSCFPGIVDHGLWQTYLEVATTRSPRRLLVDYRTDGMAGVYDVEISPFRDGVAIDFAALSGTAATPDIGPAPAEALAS